MYPIFSGVRRKETLLSEAVRRKGGRKAVQEKELTSGKVRLSRRKEKCLFRLGTHNVEEGRSFPRIARYGAPQMGEWKCRGSVKKNDT